MRFLRFVFIYILILAASVFWAFALHAQTDMGTVTGVVTDASGAVIAAATVTLTSVDTGAVRNAVVNGKGRFEVRMPSSAAPILRV